MSVTPRVRQFLLSPLVLALPIALGAFVPLVVLISLSSSDVDMFTLLVAGSYAAGLAAGFANSGST